MDASLIPTISFPAFATHEDVLCVETKANVIRRLKGRYGFKRFCRDGYKCVLEDSKKRYYRNGETKVSRMNARAHTHTHTSEGPHVKFFFLIKHTSNRISWFLARQIHL